MYAACAIGTVFYFAINCNLVTVESAFYFLAINVAYIFIFAGQDKLFSKDWISGKGFQKFALLPQYRFFKITRVRASIISKITKPVSYLELAHQNVLPYFLIASSLFGSCWMLYIFLLPSLIFFVTLTYPFNLHPISIYGFFLSILLLVLFPNTPLWVSERSLIDTAVIISSFLFFGLHITSFFPKKKSHVLFSYLVRIIFGFHKTQLFSERHTKGLLLLRYRNVPEVEQPFKSLDCTQGLPFSRFLYNNMIDIINLRLLDVFSRQDSGIRLNSDKNFLTALAKKYGTNKRVTLDYAQINYIKKIKKYRSKKGAITINNGKLLKRKKRILFWKTGRSANFRDYRPNFWPTNLLRSKASN